MLNGAHLQVVQVGNKVSEIVDNTNKMMKIVMPVIAHFQVVQVGDMMSVILIMRMMKLTMMMLNVGWRSLASCPGGERTSACRCTRSGSS